MRPGVSEKRQRAQELILSGSSVADVACLLGVTQRVVRLWTGAESVEEIAGQPDPAKYPSLECKLCERRVSNDVRALHEHLAAGCPAAKDALQNRARAGLVEMGVAS